MFQNGSYLQLYERWTYRNEPVEVVSFYKFMGLFFTKIELDTGKRNASGTMKKIHSFYSTISKKVKLFWIYEMFKMFYMIFNQFSVIQC